MIEVYTKAHCRSSRKALKLLEISGVCYERKNVSSGLDMMIVGGAINGDNDNR